MLVRLMVENTYVEISYLNAPEKLFIIQFQFSNLQFKKEMIRQEQI